MYVAEESLLDASVFYSKRYGKINRIGLIIIALVCVLLSVFLTQAWPGRLGALNGLDHVSPSK